MNSITTEAEVRRIADFFNHLRMRGRKEKTIESYHSAYRMLCDFFTQRDGSQCDWTKLTGIDFREWKAANLNIGLKPATINHRLIFSKAYVGWLSRRGTVPSEQAESIRAINEIESPQLGAKTLEPDEFRRFVRNVELSRSKRDKALIYLLLCGLRESEVAGLTRENIQVSANRGSVHITGDHVKGSAVRTVPLTRQARIHLQAYLDECPKSGRIFISERGELTEDGIYKVVRKYGDQVGVHVHPHTLRHEFSAQFLHENPGDLGALQLLLGHSSIDTTARHYARRRFSDLATGVEKIGV